MKSKPQIWVVAAVAMPFSFTCPNLHAHAGSSLFQVVYWQEDCWAQRNYTLVVCYFPQQKKRIGLLLTCNFSRENSIYTCCSIHLYFHIHAGWWRYRDIHKKAAREASCFFPPQAMAGLLEDLSDNENKMKKYSRQHLFSPNCPEKSKMSIKACTEAWSTDCEQWYWTVI